MLEHDPIHERAAQDKERVSSSPRRLAIPFWGIVTKL